MANITLKGNPIQTCGNLPEKGTQAPAFKLVSSDLSEVSLSDHAGKKIVLNIFPSVDTPVCALSVRKFNQEAAEVKGTKVFCISADLPFAFGRFCGAEGIKNVLTLSTFRNQDFGLAYGVTITTGPLAGLLSRAVLVLDEKGKVIYTEQVPEIAQEPDYESALKVIRG